MGLFAPHILVLNTASLSNAMPANLMTEKNAWLSAMKKQILALCFPDEFSKEEFTDTPSTCAVICLENLHSTQSCLAYKELIFFGKSAVCIEHALRCSGHAESLMVIGTRSLEHVALQLDIYLHRFLKSLANQVDQTQMLEICRRNKF